MPRIWLAGLLSKRRREGGSRTRKLAKMSGGKATTRKPPSSPSKTPKPSGTTVATQIKAGSSVICKGTFGSSKPFIVSKIASDTKKVQQVYDKAKPTKPAYPLAKCSLAPTVTPIKAGETVKCKGTFGSSKPFMVSKVAANAKGIRQVYDKANPAKPAYPEASCTAEAAGTEVKSTPDINGTAILNNYKVSCSKGMMGGVDTFVVSKIENKNGIDFVTGVLPDPKKTKVSYDVKKAKCILAGNFGTAPDSKKATIKATKSIVKCSSGTFKKTLSEPFKVVDITGLKGSQMVFKTKGDTKTAFKSTACTVQGANVSLDNTNAGSAPADNTNAGSAPAEPVVVGSVIPAPPPNAPPPPAENTIELTLKASEKEIASPAFKNAFTKATDGEKIDAIYDKEPDGTIKVLDPPMTGGRRRTMKGGAPKTAEEIAASKAASQQKKAAQKGTQKAASQQKKANAKTAKAAGMRQVSANLFSNSTTPAPKVKVAKTAEEIAASKAASQQKKATQKATQKAASQQKKANAKTAKAAGKATVPAAPNAAPNAAPAAPVVGLTPTVTNQQIIIETKDEIDPKTVEKKLEQSSYFKAKGTNVLPNRPSDPTPDAGSVQSNATPVSTGNGSLENGTTQKKQTKGAKGDTQQLAAINSSEGNKPFDFASLKLNPGKPVELKGNQLLSRFTSLSPGQIIHDLGDTETGTIYSEFAILDDGAIRVYRITGQKAQISSVAQAKANQMQLEEIMTGEGGYEKLYYDLETMLKRVTEDNKTYASKIASYKAAIAKINPSDPDAAHETERLEEIVSTLVKGLEQRRLEEARINKSLMGLKAGMNAIRMKSRGLAGGGKGRRHSRSRR